MKAIDVTLSEYIDFGVEINKKDRQFKVGDQVRISKYKNIFSKDYDPNWLEQVFVIKKFKSTVPWTYVISDFNGEEIVGVFDKKSCKKQT